MESTSSSPLRETTRFEDPAHLDHVYFLDKALYGLKQAPRAWYDCLSEYLLSNNYRRGAIDKTLFIQEVDRDLLVGLHHEMQLLSWLTS